MLHKQTSSLSNDPDFEEPLSECGSSGDSEFTISTQYMAIIDKQIEDTENAVKHPLNKLIYNSDAIKYRTHYTKLLESYHLLEREHIKQLKLIKQNRHFVHSERKSIESILDPFAMRVIQKHLKRQKPHQKVNSNSLFCSETNGEFIAKKWKRHYHSLFNAFDLLYKDYLFAFKKFEMQTNHVKKIKPEQIESYLYEIMPEFGISNMKICQFNKDTGILTSSSFLNDIMFHTKIHQGELEKQLSIKERVYYVLKKAKDQRGKLKLYVNTLRDELRYAMSKLKETQNIINCKLKGNDNSPLPQLNKPTVEKYELEVQVKLQRIAELERILKEEEARRKKLHNKLQELIGNIRVYCRVRPHPDCFMKFSSDDRLILPTDSLPDKMTKGWGTPMKCFIFDKVFAQSATQENVFDSVVDLITSCVDGFNVCIMAYGQTGSGKTHTMMGPTEDPGVNRRAIKELLRVCNDRKQWSYQMCLSMVEIYNEDVRDLLTPTSPTNEKKPMLLNNVKIMTKQDDDIQLQGLSEHLVTKEEDIISYLELGTKNRKVGSTLMNIQSSRSHLILLLKVNGENNVHKTLSRGTLTLCDLAGSENISKSGATGERFQEATSINKSLTSLGRVFDSLRRHQKPSYRETKLTFLLKPTLGGDSKCLLLVNVRSEPDNVEESLRALHFGHSAMQVAPELTQNKVSLKHCQRRATKNFIN